MLLTDLTELKAVLEIDPGDASEDKKLGFFIEWATRLIEEFLNRPGLSLKQRTEYYGGNGTQKLLLNSRPVYASPAPRVFIDESGYYGQASGSFSSDTELTFGSDFALKIDQEDGTSRSGMLIRLNNLWPRPTVREAGWLSPYSSDSFGNIKVIYTAGYTVDTLPAPFRLACNELVARLRYYFPLGMELMGEGYEERSISLAPSQRDYLMGIVKNHLVFYRNWRF